MIEHFPLGKCWNKWGKQRRHCFDTYRVKAITQQRQFTWSWKNRQSWLSEQRNEGVLFKNSLRKDHSSKACHWQEKMELLHKSPSPASIKKKKKKQQKTLLWSRARTNLIFPWCPRLESHGFLLCLFPSLPWLSLSEAPALLQQSLRRLRSTSLQNSQPVAASLGKDLPPSQPGEFRLSNETARK